jgi:hypothetical protein
MSTATDSTIRSGYEPIPGYRLQDQLGTGGFGEVWRCEAPGGLQKAIKFVFGSLTDNRAKRELKSLERIKGVHHPFLLTLERFEVVDGRLIIITELADGSLEDVYGRHRDRGSLGIPRKALLAYLQDAADALDYLNVNFQLQHLDVKPGNLLMVGGHVKVGDFGLLKDLRDVDCSMVGGLTPIYAPPEVFDGRPCATSDQYSLAVMYQKLLTGERPFTGRTIAQLATQHIHSAPNLESLPAVDRPVVAKALEKSPEQRFASCLEFVEALRSAGDQTVRGHRRDSRLPRGQEAATGTFQGVTPAFASEIEDLPQLPGNISKITDHGTIEHALVVGLGGSGAECLHLLRNRIASLHTAAPIDLHSVLIDTDAETIEGARLAETSGRVSPCTTIYTPLRTPNQYRERGTGHLTSISRRWLYNVPRSGMTEGMRPLGRLAMVDHAPNILRGLSESIDHLAAVCGNSVPRIYLVASLAGGTGSGMVWDIAYLLRHLMDTQGLAHAEVRPMLMIPPINHVSRQTLGTADAHAALSELLHFLKPGNSYPGDKGAGWPGVPAARSPLRGTYLVTLGDPQSNACTNAQAISEYIWTDATKGGKVLDAARSDASIDASPVNQFNSTVRSMGVARLQHQQPINLPQIAQNLTSYLIKSWLGRPVEAKQIAASLSESIAKRVGMDTQSLQQSVWFPMESDESLLWRRLYSLLSQISIGSYATENLESIFSENGMQLDEDDQSAMAYADQLVQKLRQELSQRMQDGRCDLISISESLTLIIESVAACHELHSLSGPRRTAEANDAAIAMKAAVARLQPSEVLGTPSEPGPLMRWTELRIRSAADTRIARRTKFALVGLRALADQIHHRISAMATALKEVSEANDGGIDPWKTLAAEARSRRGRIEEACKAQLAPMFVAFEAQTAQTADTNQQLVAKISASALPIVEALFADSEESDGFNTQSFASIGDALKSIRPMLLSCGGRQRLVLLVGSEGEKDAFAEQISAVQGHAVSVVVVPGVSPTLVHEAQGVPVSELLSRLQVSLGGEARILGRLQTRSDIAWNSK